MSRLDQQMNRGHAAAARLEIAGEIVQWCARLKAAVITRIDDPTPRAISGRRHRLVKLAFRYAIHTAGQRRRIAPRAAR